MSAEEAQHQSGARLESTGDPAADAILTDLQGAGDLPPDDEAETYRVALDALARLLEEQPRPPGAS